MEKFLDMVGKGSKIVLFVFQLMAKVSISPVANL